MLMHKASARHTTVAMYRWSLHTTGLTLDCANRCAAAAAAAMALSFSIWTDFDEGWEDEERFKSSPDWAAAAAVAAAALLAFCGSTSNIIVWHQLSRCNLCSTCVHACADAFAGLKDTGTFALSTARVQISQRLTCVSKPGAEPDVLNERPANSLNPDDKLAKHQPEAHSRETIPSLDTAG